MRRIVRKTLGIAMIAAFVGACSPPTDEPQVALRVENPALGIAIAEVPSGFTVASNQGEDLILHRTDEPSVVLSFELASEARGQNLHEALNEALAEFQAMDGGKYYGNVELMGPLGTAFSARGRFEEEGKAIEESRILTLAPVGNRMLILHYRYPEGDRETSRIRMNDELLAVFGEVESLTPEEDSSES